MSTCYIRRVTSFVHSGDRFMEQDYARYKPFDNHEKILSRFLLAINDDPCHKVLEHGERVWQLDIDLLKRKLRNSICQWSDIYLHNQVGYDCPGVQEMLQIWDEVIRLSRVPDYIQIVWVDSSMDF